MGHMAVGVAQGKTVYAHIDRGWTVCRAVLLNSLRCVVTPLVGQDALNMVSSYAVGITPVNVSSLDSNLKLDANALVCNIIPGISEPVLETEIHLIGALDYTSGVIFHLCPEVLHYGWAINGLIIGYLRGLCWPNFVDKTHRFDVLNLKERLDLWWGNHWAQNPEVTWYLDENVKIECSALGSVFNVHHNYPYTYVNRWLCSSHPIYEFCAHLLITNQVGDARNPSFGEREEAY